MGSTPRTSKSAPMTDASEGRRAAVLIEDGIAREGVCLVLEKLGWAPTPVADHAAALVAACRSEPPRVIVVRAQLFLRQTLASLRELSLALPIVPKVVLGTLASAYLIERCCDAGATAFLTGASRAADLGAMLEEMSREGTRSYPNPLRLPGAAPENERSPLLSPREIEVLQLIAVGADNLKIAALLGVAERTVKSHVNSLYRKIQVENRVQLVLEAEGWCQPLPPRGPALA